jgi:hypothetical protein
VRLLWDGEDAARSKRRDWYSGGLGCDGAHDPSADTFALVHLMRFAEPGELLEALRPLLETPRELGRVEQHVMGEKAFRAQPSHVLESRRESSAPDTPLVRP